MSRMSQAFADGQVAFSWRLEKIQDADQGGRDRYKATCRNKPEVFALGDSEQEALRAAQVKMTEAVEDGGVGMKSPGNG